MDKLQLWIEIIKHEGETFTTTGRGSAPGITFSYSISRAPGKGGRRYKGEWVEGYGNEIIIEGKEKTISRSTVERAFENAQMKESSIALMHQKGRSESSHTER